jgi:hypothetical protein
VIEALDTHYLKNNIAKYRKTMTAFRGENDFIDLMKEVPSSIELSSLPKIIDEKRQVVLSLSAYDKDILEKYFQKFIDFCEKNSIEYIFEDKKAKD